MPALKPTLSVIAAIAAIGAVAPVLAGVNPQPVELNQSMPQQHDTALHNTSVLIAQLNPRSEITRFYKELLGKSPDTDGLNYHLRRYNNGRSLGLIEQDFRRSPEGRRMALLLSSDAYGGAVRQLYLEELRREPEAAGFAYYVRALDRGRTLTRIRDEIRNTSEAKTKRSINDLHVQIIGGDLNSTQLQYYYNEVANNRKSLSSLREEFSRMARSTASPSPQPSVAPSPVPSPTLPTTPDGLRPPIPGNPSTLTGNAYYVVVPGGNLQEIANRMVREGAPAASLQQRQQPRGPHVALGPFQDRRLANQWNVFLRGKGFDARVYYGR